MSTLLGVLTKSDERVPAYGVSLPALISPPVESGLRYSVPRRSTVCTDGGGGTGEGWTRTEGVMVYARQYVCKCAR